MRVIRRNSEKTRFELGYSGKKLRVTLVDFKTTDFINKKDDKKWKRYFMGLLRFELKSMAPEATRMPSYPTGPRHINAMKNRVIRFITNQIII